MQTEVWKALLRRIPPDQIDNVMMMTAQGTEINVQSLLRMDVDYMVLRGRIAGSNDAGRIFILPYEQLDHMGFQKPLSDAQLQTVFDIAPAAAPPPSFVAQTAEAPNSPPGPQPVPASVAPGTPAPLPPGNAGPGLLARVPTRSKIIERLRLRTEARDGGNSTPKQ